MKDPPHRESQKTDQYMRMGWISLFVMGRISMSNIVLPATALMAVAAWSSRNSASLQV